jgi:uncharacterized protein (DUF1015 family)
MAEIIPFRALHYHPEKAGDLSRVITQPYDKITAEMQARYYELSPYNLTRVIRGRQTPQDTPKDNVYSRAARDFREWVENRVMVSELEPALYPYYQEYSVPGQPSVRKERRGFIALCRLEDYAAGVVHRHEETLSGPKADRLELLKATRAHFGQLFMLYSDPAGSIESALAAHTNDEAWERVRDEYDCRHSVWRVTDGATLARVVEAMRDEKLVIADGHHRYETALAYRDLCRSQGLPDSRAEYVMMTFVRKESEGLTVLPTHRVVHNLEGFDWQRFRSAAGRFFEWEETEARGAVSGWGRAFSARLAEAGGERPTIGAYGGQGQLAVLRLRSDLDLATTLPDVFRGQRRLDVVVLHRLLLEQVLGIDRQAVREEKNLGYVREFDDAVGRVDAGGVQVAFLMNPTPVEAVWENALAGHSLPQKSTDFYPKLLSGLTIFWLDNPAGM